MEKRKKMDPAEEGEGESKQDFRKALGGGLGMAGLSSALGAQAIADMNKKGKMCLSSPVAAATPTGPYLAFSWHKLWPKKNGERFTSG